MAVYKGYYGIGIITPSREFDIKHFKAISIAEEAPSEITISLRSFFLFD